VPELVEFDGPCTVGSAEEWGCDEPPAAGDLALKPPEWGAIKLQLDAWNVFAQDWRAAAADYAGEWEAYVNGLVAIEAARLTEVQVASRLEAQGWEWWECLAVVGVVVGALVAGTGIGAVLTLVGM